MRMIVDLMQKRIMTPGDLLPPWYYGYAYRLDHCFGAVFYPIPLHFLMRPGWMIRRGWAMFRCWGFEGDEAEDRRRQQVMYQEGYRRGFEVGRWEGIREVASSMNQRETA